jgi:2-polyprenyl-3-methyl-5-hydroxy-6-metoxy-1,4-benzoquinol methylase
MKSKDKAGESLWTTLWKGHELPQPIMTKSINPNNYINKRMHQFFEKIFSNRNTKGQSLLEIGCANSVWLPYFAKEYELEVTGLDYSEYGCEQSRRILERDGVSARIFNVDFFNPPNELLNHFDYIFSLGVVEHFEDTTEVLEIFSKFLKPGGIIITQIPNLTSMEGDFHKWFNRNFYNVHNVMNKNKLVDAHKKAGFKVIESCYLISISFYVNLIDNGKKVKNYWLKKGITYSLSSMAKIIWFFESFFGSLPVTQSFSPVIFVVAQKTSDD